MTENEIIDSILNNTKIEDDFRHFQEESAELTIELCRLLRPDKSFNAEDILEEIADVEIMLAILKKRVSLLTDADFNLIKQSKLNKCLMWLQRKIKR